MTAPATPTPLDALAAIVEVESYTWAGRTVDEAEDALAAVGALVGAALELARYDRSDGSMSAGYVLRRQAFWRAADDYDA